MRKIKFNQKLDLIFWSVIIIITFMELYNSGLISEFKSIIFQDITLLQYVETILFMFVVVLLNIFLSMFRFFELTILYFGIKIAQKKYNKDRIEKVDLRNDSYYRDILPRYSPAVLSYLDDFKINIEDIVATLLMLELKEKIKIKDSGIVLLDDKIDDLEENEKYILNKVKEHKIKDIDIFEYTSIVRNDALKKGLLQEKKEAKKRIKISIVIYLFIMIVNFLIPNFMIETSNNLIMILCIILFFMFLVFLIFMPGFTIVYAIHYKILNTIDPYIRNDEGKMVNLKLEGLRKYLIDFSKIEEKTKEQLILWEEYLVYSVILGINAKIVEEVYDKIK